MTYFCVFVSDGKNSQTLLGALDSAFLFAYAAGMFFRRVYILYSLSREIAGRKYSLFSAPKTDKHIPLPLRHTDLINSKELHLINK